MARYATVDAWVTVDVDLEDIDTEDLIEELEERGIRVEDDTSPSFLIETAERLWLKRRLNQPHEQEINDIIYYVVGRIV